MITVEHNFDPSKFKWLWAMYVHDANPSYHCRWCLKGKFSKKFSKTSNPDMKDQHLLVMDEYPDEMFRAVYFCGVSSHLYSKHQNYPHNVHFAVEPAEGHEDLFTFENWTAKIKNGKLLEIPDESRLVPKFFREPYTPDFYTCRIFRWAVNYFGYNHE
jgi:hypothetical protein